MVDVSHSLLVPFNKPYVTGQEIAYIQDACARGVLSGNGYYTQQCQDWLSSRLGAHKALLTNSCTAALEMSAILLDISSGDEVIMPSYTFVSTANAFVLYGAKPVFVDVDPETFNIDASAVESAITDRTKAIVAVHYAGVSCDMDVLVAVAKNYGIPVIEDAAQSILSSYKGRPLGSIGDLACLSFHETKNIISGEGGALLINDESLAERAEIIWEKGTNRSQFFRGQVDKYTWCDVGSSFLPSEITAAFLWAQLEVADEINGRRLAMWDKYHNSFESLERKGCLVRPVMPDYASSNAHMYFILLPDLSRRQDFISKLKVAGVMAVFHYVPLHSSPAGMLHGRCNDALPVTQDVSERLVRLPLWVGLEAVQDRVISVVENTILSCE